MRPGVRNSHGLWLALGALGGWLAAYPLTALALWGVVSAAPGATPELKASGLFSQSISGPLLRMIPVNLISALLGAGVGLLINRNLRVRLALQESEERFRRMAVSAPDAIIMMDPRGRVSYWNAASEKIFGYAREEALGMDLHQTIVPPRFRESFEKGYAEFEKTGRGHAMSKTIELAALRRDGSEFPVELSLSALHLGGEWHALGIVRDISDRKQAEDAKLAHEKLQGVLEMAGATCHNMNQPLQSVLWHIQVLLEELSADNYLYKELELIKSQVDRMTAISRKIMDITRYETIPYYKDIKIIDIDKASGKAATPPPGK